jgi:hypothetical protein
MSHVECRVLRNVSKNTAWQIMNTPLCILSHFYTFTSRRKQNLAFENESDFMTLKFRRWKSPKKNNFTYKLLLEHQCLSLQILFWTIIFKRNLGKLGCRMWTGSMCFAIRSGGGLFSTQYWNLYNFVTGGNIFDQVSYYNCNIKLRSSINVHLTEILR